MDREFELTLFNEITALRGRVEELERQLAAVMTTAQTHANALKLILTAAKVEHDKEALQ
jgi:hypothetical protein